MWYRSYVLVDRFGRSEGTTEWVIQSSYGRILIGRVDHSTAINVSKSNNWSFRTERMRSVRFDPWEPSIWKSIGVEYRGEPLNAFGAVGGWWLRVRWPTLVVASGIIPLWRVVVARRKRREAVQIAGL
jgi:hypothetical protein